MSGWDIALIASVSIMGTAIAYLRNPEYKAFVLMLPVPFTLALLTLGRPLDATNALAVVPSFGFLVGVWLLHARLRQPILIAIPVCALAYCVVGVVLAKLLPSTGDWMFWVIAIMVFAGALVLILKLPHRAEPYHRTPLPIWIKLPAIALVVTFLVLIKQYLGGFLTMFPMVGVVAAYEARNSLWALVRRFPWVASMMIPFMVVIRLTQEHIGIMGALALAWPILLALLWLFRKQYHRDCALPSASGSQDVSQLENSIKTKGMDRIKNEKKLIYRHRPRRNHAESRCV